VQTDGLNCGEILLVHLVAFWYSLCKISCRCSCILDVFSNVLDVILVFYRLIPVRLKWCDVRKFRGGGLHASRVKS
jgi:hypothetical protein